ncbi:hypothetical protein JCM6882_009677 [Rhodosporidiobolus microsporus]
MAQHAAVRPRVLTDACVRTTPLPPQPQPPPTWPQRPPLLSQRTSNRLTTTLTSPMARSRLTAPSKLNLVPVSPGTKPSRFPKFPIPSPPPPTFIAPVRAKSISGGTGVAVGRLPKL